MKIKPMPAVMTVLSALYFLYVLSSPDTTLVADAVGGDPGGKVLPMIMSAFLFIGFLYITLKERPDGKPMDKQTTILFFTTLGLTVAYVLLMKTVGFVLLSAVLVYVLEYMFTTAGENRDPVPAAVGGAATVTVTSLCYLLMRFITKTLLVKGRGGEFPSIFGSTVFEGCISVVLVAVLTAVLYTAASRLLKGDRYKKIIKPAAITFAVVLLLYVIFKQFFNVNLAPGLLKY